MSKFEKYLIESDQKFDVIVDGEKIAEIESYMGTSESRSKGKRYVNSRKSVKRWGIRKFFVDGKSVSHYPNGNIIMFSSYSKYKSKSEAIEAAKRDYKHIKGKKDE